MNDPIEELRAVQRAVGADRLPAGKAHVVRLARHYPADVADVWDAITDPARLSRWFLPVHGDLRLGGTYQLEGNAGGEIRVCDPPTRLVVTWLAGEPPSDEDSSIVDLLLEPVPEGGTTLTLTHTAGVPPEFWDQYGPGAVGVGWDMTTVGLAMHLEGEEIGTPEEMDRDPAMQAAMVASSEAWGDAHAASGEDPDVVARATAATTAFYVPDPSGT